MFLAERNEVLEVFFKCRKEVKGQSLVIPEKIATHPAWIRLEDQVDWYDNKSECSQQWYKFLKLVQIVLAVSIPVLTHFEMSITKWIIAFSGALIAVLEGVQHMNQYSTLWVTYRSTAERLKHEKFLFLSMAGPYRELDESARLTLLAERVEEHVSTEHANWINETRTQPVPREKGNK